MTGAPTSLRLLKGNDFLSQSLSQIAPYDRDMESLSIQYRLPAKQLQDDNPPSRSR